jgi:catechol 1,2-dioxygenase
MPFHGTEQAMVENHESLTRAVLAVMERTPDARLREIMVSLVAHLHGFVKDVRLTEDEFRAASALLASLGQQSNERHNEVVLMAGSLGLSSLVCLLNNGPTDAGERRETTQNLLGPFWRMNSPRTANAGSIVRGPTPGPALWVSARVLDLDGAPVAGAEADVWQCAGDGLYENQPAARAQGVAEMNLRGKFSTDAQGTFSFWSVKPVGYPIPTDGVVGQMLLAQGRRPMRPAHLHALIHKPGFKTLISQVYADDDPNLASDAQFGVTRALTGHFERHDRAPAARPELAPPWFSLDFTFRMEPGESRLPRPPIP